MFEFLRKNHQEWYWKINKFELRNRYQPHLRCINLWFIAEKLRHALRPPGRDFFAEIGTWHEPLVCADVHLIRSFVLSTHGFHMSCDLPDHIEPLIRKGLYLRPAFAPDSE